MHATITSRTQTMQRKSNRQKKMVRKKRIDAMTTENSSISMTSNEQNERMEVIIKVRRVEESLRALQKVKEVIRQKIIECGPLRSITPLKGGRLILRFTASVTKNKRERSYWRS